MKVLMLMRYIQKGGASQNWVWVGKTLADKGHDVVAMTFAPCRDISVADNVKWIQCPELQDKNIFAIINSIRKVVKDYAPDICISFLLDANIYNILACKGFSTKSVVCERNDPFKPGYWKLRLLKPLFRFADGAVYQLPKVAEYYSNIKSPTAVIPNPVLFPPTIKLKPFSEREDKICVIGRFDNFQKRNDVMVEAFRYFSEWFPKYKLYFYGRGGDEENVKNLVKSYGLEDKVLFPGFTSTPHKEMSDSKMFVLTSDFEGIPNTLMDAMALGLPCVSTDCRPGGAALLIENKVNGFIVPKGDSHAVAERMKLIASDPELADMIGNNAKNILSRFSQEKMGILWNDYISSIVK